MTSSSVDLGQVADHQPALGTLSGSPAELIAQGVLASPTVMNYLNEWRQYGIYTYQQLQDAVSRSSMQNQPTDPPSQLLPLSTDSYAELDTTHPRNSERLPQYHLPEGDTSTELGECDESPHHRLAQITAIKEKQNISCLMLQMHRENADFHRESAKLYQGYLQFHQKGALTHQESVDLEEALLQQLDAELEDAQAGRQHKSQGGNYNRKNISHDSGSSGAGQNRQKQSDDTNVPDFMKEYVSGRPEAEEPPADDQPGVKRCSIGRPVGKKLERGTVYYKAGRCDKHLRKSVFVDNMKIQMDSQNSYKLVEHAWKCSGEATLRPLALEEVRHQE